MAVVGKKQRIINLRLGIGTDASNTPPQGTSLPLAFSSLLLPLLLLLFAWSGSAHAVQPSALKKAIVASQLADAGKVDKASANPEMSYGIETFSTDFHAYESYYDDYKNDLAKLTKDKSYMQRNLRGVDDLRRSIIVSFQRKKYAKVVSDYDKANSNASLNQYSDELSLLYGISLLQRGSYSSATAILSNLAQKAESKDITRDDYNLIALDALAEYAVLTDNITPFLKPFEIHVANASDYSVAAYLQHLLNAGSFAQLETINKTNPLIGKHLLKNPKLNEFKTKGYYLTQQYEKVLSYGREFNTPSTYNIALDSAAILGNSSYLKSFALRVPKGVATNSANTKLAITLGDDNDILRKLNNTPQNYLEGYRYYQYKAGANTNQTILDSIYDHSSTITRTHINTNNAIQLISSLKCNEAMAYIDENIEQIPLDMNLYLGECLLLQDNEIAKKYLYTYLDNTGKQEANYWKAKSLLALALLANNETTQSSIIIDDCKTGDCNLVRSYSQLRSKRYVAALNTANKIDDANLNTVATGVRLLSFYALGRCDDVISIATSQQVRFESTSYAIADCYLTQGNEAEGLKYLDTHIKTNATYIKLGMKYFFSKKEYNKTIALATNMNNSRLDSDIALLLGYSYHSIGQYNQAYRYYKAIATSNSSNTPMGIESMINIWSNITSYNATADITSILLTNKGIVNREIYLLQAATLFTKSNRTNEAFQLVNTLFDDYSKPESIRGAYVVRAELFYQLTNYNACIADVKTGLTYKENDEAPLLYYQALCSEYVNPEASLTTYQQLRQYPEFEYLANEKVIELSDNPKLLLDSANYFSDKNQNLYNKGIEKFLILVPLFELAQNTNYLSVLENSKEPNTRAKGYYLRGQLAERGNNYTQAIASYLLTYYTTTDQTSKTQTKEQLIQLYTKLGLQDRVAEINSL